MKPFSLTELQPLLRDGETLVGESRAELSLPKRRLPVIGLGQWSIRQAKTSFLIDDLIEKSADTAIPLDLHMVIVLTSERLLVWGSDASPKDPDSLLADVPRSQIKWIRTEPRPLGRKIDVQIALHDGTTAIVRVENRFGQAMEDEFISGPSVVKRRR